MKKNALILAFVYLLCSSLNPPVAKSSDVASQNNLLNDLLIVDYWNRKVNDRLPVTFNHLLQGGYINMPSARMGNEGEVGAGYAYIPPYRNYNLRIQLTDRVEISGNYRVFHGIKDPVLGPLGYGDYSDKGANLKLALFHAEDTDYKWPGLSIGADDVMGTRSFNAYYMVMTQVLLQQNLEISLGYGWDRIRRWFGGFSWMPLRNSGNPFLQGISLTAEYDAIHYKSPRREPHPKGRKTKSPINFGLKYRLWDRYDLSLSYVRGDALAFSASTFYNFGMTKGFFAKFNDPLPYREPVITGPIGPLRTEEAMVEDLKCGFREQSFDLLQVWISYDPCGNKVLRIKVYNNAYRTETEVRNRLNNLLAYLIPENIDKVIVVMESTGFPIQEYYFTMEYVRQFGAKGMGPYELEVISPLREVTFPDKCTETLLFDQPQELWNLEIFPLTRCYFGSAKGKFKYSLGVQVGIDGFLPKDVYYAVLLGCPIVSDIGKVGDKDRLNPSQLINVRTDMTRYYKYRGVSINEMYLQKSWNMGKGFYARCAAGYFEDMYGGVAGELLYYPINKPWAFGIEGAVVKKRKIGSLFFTNKIRKLHGFTPTYHHFLGSQYFLDLYYDWHLAKLEFKTMAGKFLANDWGARFEVSRYFPSGLRITLWYTLTNGNDRVNGHRYYDKGVLFSMPLDIFYTHSDRFRWHYGMAAWLRDVGATAETGQKLYWLINNQREH